MKKQVTVSNANIHDHLLQLFPWTANSRMLISDDVWMYNLSGGIHFSVYIPLSHFVNA